MEPSSTQVERRWRGWQQKRNRRGLHIGFLLLVVLYPAFGLLDWLIAPREALPALFGMRSAVVVLGSLALLFRRRRFIRRNTDLLGVLTAWLGASGISLMTVYMGGLASPYYAGLILFVVAAGLLFVWPFPLVVAAQAGIIATLPLFNLLGGSHGDAFRAGSNLAFLCAVALIAGVGQVHLYSTHREQQFQRIRLEQATAHLERAHRDLKQLDSFKSRFFANITHELRTPLALVLTPLELLNQGEMGPVSDDQRSAFQTMFKNALKLLKLINDLLDLSRLEESGLRLRVRKHDLVGHLRTLVEETTVLAQRRSIALRFTASADQAEVHCDLERMERVFVNLISNAVKFTPDGGHVEVNLRDAPRVVEVSVQDDGPGFPPELAPRLFERFFQVDMAGTRQFGGTGIGLALARELVLLHGGQIEAHSDGKTGARFTVTLRKGEAHLPPEAISVEEPISREGDFGAESAVQLSGRRDFRLLDVEEATERRVVERDHDEHARPYTAVVVEDHPQVVRLIHSALRRHFRVLNASDGLKGLEMVLREKPSLVVTDLMMPGIDGLELTRRLHHDERTRHIPILMLSARGELEDRVAGLETGVSAYLTKPFSPRELVSAARRLVHATEETAELVLTQRMESLEIVAAGLAHEINNPLQYVKSSLSRVRLDAVKALGLASQAGNGPLAPEDTAQVTKLSARIRSLLDVADSGLLRIARTVELMGRYGRSGYRREVVPHDVWEAARTVVGIVLPATGRGVKVDFDLEGDGTIDCVPDELNQVITNLVQNAIEASPDGEGRVRITGRVDDGHLLLSVLDNGPGIPDDVQARLFTPFYSTKGPGRGVGLGLTISRRVVQSLGGTLQASSKPGSGAQFTVRIPRRRAHLVPVDAAG